MLVEIALGLMLAAGAAKPERVAIYVSAPVRDGFVDVDAEILDSIVDVQKRLRQDPFSDKRDAVFRVVAKEADAVLRLYVLGRGATQSTGEGLTIHSPGTATHFPGQTLTFPHGGTVQLPGTTILSPGISTHVATTARHVSAKLRVGTYERDFIAVCETWKQCAGRLVDGLSVWVMANLERIGATKP